MFLSRKTSRLRVNVPLIFMFVRIPQRALKQNQKRPCRGNNSFWKICSNSMGSNNIFSIFFNRISIRWCRECPSARGSHSRRCEGSPWPLNSNINNLGTPDYTHIHTGLTLASNAPQTIVLCFQNNGAAAHSRRQKALVERVA